MQAYEDITRPLLEYASSALEYLIDKSENIKRVEIYYIGLY